MTLDQIIEALRSRTEIEARINVGVNDNEPKYEWLSAYVVEVERSHSSTWARITVVCHIGGSQTARYSFNDGELATKLRPAASPAQKLVDAEKRVLALQMELAVERGKRINTQNQLDVAVAAVELLKKEIGYKADALAEFPVNRLTADVITRHIAALRSLT